VNRIDKGYANKGQPTADGTLRTQLQLQPEYLLALMEGCKFLLELRAKIRNSCDATRDHGDIEASLTASNELQLSNYADSISDLGTVLGRLLGALDCNAKDGAFQ